MEYQTVYDISQESFHWGFPIAGLFIALVGFLVLIAVSRNIIKPRIFQTKNQARYIGILICAFGIFFSVAAMFITYIQYAHNRSLINSGQVSVIEGNVENFIPMPYEGKSLESFTVSGIKFEYSDYVYSNGFNNTSSHGGPIREGLPVRIHYSGNTILKLEIKNGH